MLRDVKKILGGASTNLKLIGAVVVVVVAIGIGVVLWNAFSQDQPQGETGLLIDEVEWMWEGDYRTMSIPIRNVAVYPVTIESISVRENAFGSTEYTDNDPIGISSGTNEIGAGGADTFKWNVGRGSAPFEFLQPGKTYVIKVTTGTDFCEKTVTAPEM